MLQRKEGAKQTFGRQISCIFIWNELALQFRQIIICSSGPSACLIGQIAFQDGKKASLNLNSTLYAQKVWKTSGSCSLTPTNSGHWHINTGRRSSAIGHRSIKHRDPRRSLHQYTGLRDFTRHNCTLLFGDITSEEALEWTKKNPKNSTGRVCRLILPSRSRKSWTASHWVQHLPTRIAFLTFHSSHIYPSRRNADTLKKSASNLAHLSTDEYPKQRHRYDSLEKEPRYSFLINQLTIRWLRRYHNKV